MFCLWPRAFRLEEIGRRDNVDMPFRMDEKLLGQWKTVGFADSIEAFAGPVDSQDELWLKTVEFCADGTAIRSYGEETWHDKWTKGFLLDLKKSTASAYSFQRILGTEYLFLEWKMGNYVYGGLELGYYVFVKL